MTCAAMAGADLAFPPDLRRSQTCSSEVRARDGSLLRAFLTADGQWRLRTTASDVDPRYVDLLVAAEDHRFRDGGAVDPWALLRAAWQWGRQGRIVSGGSTLTMQVARLLEPHRRGVIGKLHDIVRALQLARRFGKARILDMYLTLAPFGGNLEGVRAASLAYFGTAPERLTAAQAALLVALPQSPARRRPDRHQAAAEAARNRLLQRLAQAGALGEAQAQEAAATPVAARRRNFPRAAAAFAAGLAREAPPGAIIRSTIDPTIQTALVQVVDQATAGLPHHTGAAVLVIDNVTRGICGYASKDGFYLDLTTTRRSPGSALKPFIYGLAFDALALHPLTLIDDAPLQLPGYAPENFDHAWHGLVTASEALQQSLNIPALRVMMAVGPSRFVARLRQSGAVIDVPAGQPGLAVALGGLGISLRDLAMLYTALADDGVVAPLRDDMATPMADGTDRLVTPLGAYYLQAILRGSPVPDGMAPAQSTIGRGIAFKTGTSYGFRDAWAAGYSGRYTVAVWVGRIEGSSSPGAYGRKTAAPLLFGVFGALPPEPASTLPVPVGLIAARQTADLPPRLRTLDRGAPAGAALLFPPDRSSVDLLADLQGRLRPITLRAGGGRLPLRWIVNGMPLLHSGSDGHVLQWAPPGPGFVRVTIIDADDRATRSTFRLIQPEDE